MAAPFNYEVLDLTDEQVDAEVALRGPDEHPRHDAVARERGDVRGLGRLVAGAAGDVAEHGRVHRRGPRALEPLEGHRQVRRRPGDPGEVDPELVVAVGHGDTLAPELRRWQSRAVRVIVAGATGAVGRPLVERLLAHGHEVIGLSRRPVEGRGWSGAIVADVLDHDGLLAAAKGVRADAVIHELTAIRGIPLRYRDLDATTALAEIGKIVRLRLADAVGATRMVTQSFLGGYGFVPRGPEPIAEGAPFAVPAITAPPLRPIIEALKAAERLTRSTPGIEGVALRYGLFYGPDSMGPLASMLRRRALPVPRSGGGVHSYVFVPDAAAAAVAALERGRPGRSYNVCDDRATGWNDFFDAAARAAGAPPPLRVPDAVFRALPYVDTIRRSSIPMSNARAKEELGWSPSVASTQEGLLRSVV